MYLSKISQRNIRNLSQSECKLSPHLNLIYGENASGKSSFLEAVYILSSGRSFRSRHFKDIISHGKSDCLVAGTVISNNSSIPLGYQRKQDNVEIHINRQAVNKSSLLAQQLPLQIIHPQSDDLILAGPNLRRRYLDWGVFHVEQSFHACWQKYQHVLKQRNAALKSRREKAEVQLWDRPLAEKAFEIHQLRKNYFLNLVDQIDSLQSKFFPDANIRIEYKPGWQTQEDFLSLLDKNYQRDCRFGATQYGPHKADLLIMADGHKAAEYLSRGQLKNVVILMTLGQILSFHKHTGKNCIVLIDDLLSELDHSRAQSILTLLASLDTQLIITAINKTDALWNEAFPSYKMFHVEHGELVAEEM